VEGGPWTVVYLALMAFSVFAVLQNIPQAFVARFLIVVVPTLLLWWRMVPGRQGRAALLRRRSAALSAGG
jgi:membrane protein implicated in regulation of membrane protease activity